MIENGVPSSILSSASLDEIVFGMLKRKLSMKRQQKAVRFRSIDGKKKILSTLRGFWQINEQRLLSIFIREAKKWILLWRSDEIINSKVYDIQKEVTEDRKA